MFNQYLVFKRGAKWLHRHKWQLSRFTVSWRHGVNKHKRMALGAWTVLWIVGVLSIFETHALIQDHQTANRAWFHSCTCKVRWQSNTVMSHNAEVCQNDDRMCGFRCGSISQKKFLTSSGNNLFLRQSHFRFLQQTSLRSWSLLPGGKLWLTHSRMDGIWWRPVAQPVAYEWVLRYDCRYFSGRMAGECDKQT